MRLGSSAMTLEAVAKEANVSKGGLLYHFPTKESLIKGMLNLLVQAFESSLNNEIQQEIAEGNGLYAGRWHRAYVRVAISPSEKIDSLMSALLVAFAFDPQLPEAMTEIAAHWRKMAETDGLDPVGSKIVRLAADGFWYSRLFKFGNLYGSENGLPALREQLLEFIAKSVRECDSTE